MAISKSDPLPANALGLQGTKCASIPPLNELCRLCPRLCSVCTSARAEMGEALLELDAGRLGTLDCATLATVCAREPDSPAVDAISFVTEP